MARTGKTTEMKSVLKTLSAVRATMSSEEQKILDTIVVSGVEGDEVMAHKMQEKTAVQRFDQKTSPKVTTETAEDEVVAHAMQAKVTDQRVSQAKTTASISVYFDTESGEYRQRV